MDDKKYFFLWPLSLVFRLVTDIRNLMYDKGIIKSVRFNIPIISIGNITVGGTGKTPHTEYISDLLCKDFRVAVLSRGYNRKTRGFIEVKSSFTTNETGDEPLQIARKFPDVLVAVDEERVNGVKTILETHPETGVIILDDAFQHRRIKAGLSILLVDFNRLISRDHLLPYGRLREKWRNARRANLILVTKSPDGMSDTEMDKLKKELEISSRQYIFFTSTAYQDPIPVFENYNTEYHLSEADRKQQGAVLVTGIARPKPFKLYLEKFFEEIIHLVFPDHHHFNNDDLLKIDRGMEKLKTRFKVILTTSKDAVRLRDFINISPALKKSLYHIPVGVVFLKNGKQEFDNLIINYVRENNKDNRVP